MGPLAAEGLPPDYALTLPWYVWGVVGAGIVTAIVTLFKSFKAAVEAQNAQMTALVREVVGAIAANTASLQEVLRAVQESHRA
jgi:hypothetical protein